LCDITKYDIPLWLRFLSFGCVKGNQERDTLLSFLIKMIACAFCFQE